MISLPGDKKQVLVGVATATTLFAVAMSFCHLIVASPLFLVPTLPYRSLHILSALILGFLVTTNWNDIKKATCACALIILSVWGFGYMVVYYQQIEERVTWTGNASFWEITITVLAIFVILEATRRVLGMAMVFISMFFIAYGFLGPYLRNIEFLRVFAHSGVSVSKIVDQLYFSYEGIFGVSIGVTADMVFVFILFGAFLNQIKAGELFVDITRPLASKSVGGPAKTAVLGSALLGIISGSSVANVVTSGTVTIPMMKKYGYEPAKAAAVEAVASTGGQIMPPVMGAGAFIMADILGIGYGEIITRAAIPAFLYFFAVFVYIHYDALKNHMKSDDNPNQETLLVILKKRWTLFIPLIVILALIANGSQPRFAGFYGVLAAAIVPFLRNSTKIPLKNLWAAMEEGAKNSVSVIVACACAGIVVGMIGITGLGFKFNTAVMELASGSLAKALVLAMLTGFVFGMGLPTTAAYIIQASLIAPSLIQMGAPPFAAHLFVFYYAVLGAITPPIAVSSFTAAPLAGADPYKVGWIGFMIGLPIYFVPFLFVYKTGLFLDGDMIKIAMDTVTAIFCVYVFAVSIVGYWGERNLNVIMRFALLALALIAIHPNQLSVLVSLIGSVLVWQWQKKYKMQAV